MTASSHSKLRSICTVMPNPFFFHVIVFLKNQIFLTNIISVTFMDICHFVSSYFPLVFLPLKTHLDPCLLHMNLLCCKKCGYWKKPTLNCFNNNSIIVYQPNLFTKSNWWSQSQSECWEVAVPCAVTVQSTFGRGCELAAIARWRGGDGESRWPLAVLAIWNEKRRNLGQLCHPFEVGTACLWSGGWVLSFHVLLLCDLGRPQLHKPYWLYRLEKKKRKRHNLFQHLWCWEAWSFMKWDEWQSCGSFKSSPWHDFLNKQ